MFHQFFRSLFLFLHEYSCVSLFLSGPDLVYELAWLVATDMHVRAWLRDQVIDSASANSIWERCSYRSGFSSQLCFKDALELREDT